MSEQVDAVIALHGPKSGPVEAYVAKPRAESGGPFALYLVDGFGRGSEVDEVPQDFDRATDAEVLEAAALILSRMSSIEIETWKRSSSASVLATWALQKGGSVYRVVEGAEEGLDVYAYQGLDSRTLRSEDDYRRLKASGAIMGPDIETAARRLGWTS